MGIFLLMSVLIKADAQSGAGGTTDTYIQGDREDDRQRDRRREKHSQQNRRNYKAFDNARAPKTVEEDHEWNRGLTVPEDFGKSWDNEGANPNNNNNGNSTRNTI